MSADPGVSDARVSLLECLIEPTKSFVGLAPSRANLSQLKRIARNIELLQLLE